MKIEKSPILITGAARSGTSLIGGVINICGAFGGDMFGPNIHNQKGMHENIKIRENVDKGYLRSIKMDPKGQFPLPDTNSLPIPSDWRKQVEDIIIEEGNEDGDWFYKGARSCLFWPVWHYAYPNAKWVIVRRRTADIASSCLNTGFMNYYKDYDGWVKWVNHHEDKFVEMITSGLNVKQIWPERMIRGDYEQLYELIEWLGLTWRSKEVMDFIEPALWKAKKKHLRKFE